LAVANFADIMEFDDRQVVAVSNGNGRFQTTSDWAAVYGVNR